MKKHTLLTTTTLALALLASCASASNNETSGFATEGDSNPATNERLLRECYTEAYSSNSVTEFFSNLMDSETEWEVLSQIQGISTELYNQEFGIDIDTRSCWLQFPSEFFFCQLRKLQENKKEYVDQVAQAYVNYERQLERQFEESFAAIQRETLQGNVELLERIINRLKEIINSAMEDRARAVINAEIELIKECF